MIIAGAGADELLDLTLRALLPPGGSIITCSPSFGMYPFLADVNELRLIDAPRGDRFALNGEALLSAVDALTGDGIVVLTSPNNPSGDLVPRDLLIEILARGATVMLDEAYIEFAGMDASAQGLLEEFPRLIIMRTFSKWAGIAGLRLGYALGNADLVSDLIKGQAALQHQPGPPRSQASPPPIAPTRSANRSKPSAPLENSSTTRCSAWTASPLCRPSRTTSWSASIPAIGSGRELHDRLASVGVFTRTYRRPIACGLSAHLDAPRRPTRHAAPTVQLRPLTYPVPSSLSLRERARVRATHTLVQGGTPCA